MSHTGAPAMILPRPARRPSLLRRGSQAAKVRARATLARAAERFEAAPRLIAAQSARSLFVASHAQCASLATLCSYASRGPMLWVRGGAVWQMGNLEGAARGAGLCELRGS